MPKIDLLAPPAENEAPGISEARDFLAGNAPTPTTLPDIVAEALVNVLAARGDAEKLSALALAPDKTLAKQARRGIHVLRAKGIKAEVPKPLATPHFAKEPQVEILSLCTAGLRDGESILWHVQANGPASEDGRLDIHQARVSELDGLFHFESFRATRKQWRELEKVLGTETKLPIAHIPRRWARWLIEESVKRAEAKGHTVPREYLKARIELADPEPYEIHPALTTITPEAIARETEKGNLERALLLPETRSFVPDEADIESTVAAVNAIADSPLVLDEHVRMERVLDVLHKAAAQALATEWRPRLARRFLDTAYFIESLSHDASPASTRDFHADAALCVVASRSISDETTPPETNRIAQALFTRLLELMVKPPEATRPAPPTSNLIL